ncbi:MAG: TetR/AcrR family transcriptional regulator [Candidatus Binatia bacterium]
MATVETRERILDAAEALFARQGFSATSLRNVIAEAGVNLAAVHYHFGSREELIRAVFARRFDPVNLERLALLDAMNAQKGRARSARRLERLLECLLIPLLKVAHERPGDWSAVTLLVGRAHTDPDFVVRKLLHGQFDELFRRFSAELAGLLPHLDTAELSYRFHFSIAAMAVTLVHGDDVRQLSDGQIDPAREPEVFVRRWVAFAAAGLRAPSTNEIAE